MHQIVYEEQQIIEGGAAVGIAALLAGKVDNTDHSVIVISDKNISMQLHQKLINGQLPDIYWIL